MSRAQAQLRFRQSENEEETLRRLIMLIRCVPFDASDKEGAPATGLPEQARASGYVGDRPRDATAFQGKNWLKTHKITPIASKMKHRHVRSPNLSLSTPTA